METHRDSKGRFASGHPGLKSGAAIRQEESLRQVFITNFSILFGEEFVRQYFSGMNQNQLNRILLELLRITIPGTKRAKRNLFKRKKVKGTAQLK